LRRLPIAVQQRLTALSPHYINDLHAPL